MTFLDRSMFIGAFLDDKLIGFLKLTSDEAQTQAALMNIVSMIQHRDKAPTNALIAQAVRSCAEREIPFLVYSNFAHGKKQRDSLSDFKKNNGFKRIDLPRYYVPLTGTGRVALRLGLHHKIAEHFPEPVIATLRQFRNAWYNRRVRPMTEIEIS
ncbi:MAG: thiamine phosphate synthase [Acidobacteriia bacterium]|nr:thiamine phosphate synthase [Terriglobia bacterium]